MNSEKHLAKQNKSLNPMPCNSNCPGIQSFKNGEAKIVKIQARYKEFLRRD